MSSVISNEDNSSEALEFVSDSETHTLRRINETSWILKRRIVTGSIIKVPTTHLFGEQTATGTHMTHMYRIPTSITTDVIDHGRTWYMRRAVKHLRLIYPDFPEIDHHEDDLILVKRSQDEGPNGNF